MTPGALEAIIWASALCFCVLTVCVTTYAYCKWDSRR